MKLSVIIPAYNEENFIGDTIRSVQKNGDEHLHEIIVVDGESSDNTIPRARKAGARVVVSLKKGRAAQMNYGAEKAKGDIFYFLHADSTPPPDFDQQINLAVSRGFASGCFRLGFDYDHVLLDFYAWCTRFDINAFRFGDQSLFIERDLFFEIGGYQQDYRVMEDNEIVRRIKNRYPFAILDDTVETSARSYQKAGVVKLQIVFAIIYLLYFLGVEQETLSDLKRKIID